MITCQNVTDLERVQKLAFKIILGDKYYNYTHALNVLDLQTLADRRSYLCKKFALKNVNNEKFQDLFVKNSKSHIMNTRNPDTFHTQYAHTERLKRSPIIYMQRLLNENC